MTLHLVENVVIPYYITHVCTKAGMSDQYTLVITDMLRKEANRSA